MSEMQFPFRNPILPGDLWNEDADYKIPVFSLVGNGPKGEACKFDDMTEHEKTEIIQLAIDAGLKGDKGDKGDTGNFDQLTQTQKDEVAEYVGEQALQASFTVLDGVHEMMTIGEGASESVIDIPIQGYTASDILFVFIEGLYLAPGVDYTLGNGYITLAQPLTHLGMKVYFRAIRATWGD